MYIGGTGTSGSQSSYAFILSSTASAENIMDNVFCNSRTNSGGTGTHYAISLQNNSITDINYNNYFVSGSGGVLGFISSSNKNNLNDWKSATGKDINSLNQNPLFVNQGGTQATNYYTGAYLPAVTIQGVTHDYNNILRPTAPSMGALESFLWTGSNSNSYTDALNWTSGTVPLSGASIIFASNPVNHCLLQANIEAAGVINTQPTYKLNLNGYSLSVNGALDLSGGAQIIASTPGSTITFKGTSLQNISQGAFTNNEVYNLTVDNSSGVDLNSDLTISNNLIINDNAILNVTAGKKLTVEGALTNLEGVGGLILKADATGTSSLLHYSPDVKATVQKYLPSNSYGWTVCSPVKTANSSLFSGHINTYYYNPLLPGWAVFSSGNMENMLGYWTKFDNNKTIEFADTLHEGTLVYSNLYRTGFGSGNFGWNFIGNPYPSAIDWDAVVALSDNGSGYAGFFNATKLNASIYIADNNGGYNSYVNGSGTGGFDGVIPAATSFFIQVNKNYINASAPVDGAKLTFKNDVRLHQTEDSKSLSQQNVLGIKLSDGMYSDEALFRFKPDASCAFDPAYDALKMFADNKNLPQVFALFNDDKMSINSLDENFNDLITIPLGIYSASEGSHVFSADFSSLDQNINVYLEDLYENKILDLSTTPIYPFIFANNEDDNRFLLHFSKNAAATHESREDAPFINIYAVDNMLFAELYDENALLKIFDLPGKEIYTANISKGISKHEITFAKGFYMVSVISSNKTLTKKIFFK
ncbi:MAG: hypothetical protein BWY70_00960 [Bacteroidetes bacterium ADurb.Bin408]|nr:MAG: hypothetical protein BWY70_00960 [Bacteroidetes bacterium ADurb.Bin408]